MFAVIIVITILYITLLIRKEDRYFFRIIMNYIRFIAEFFSLIILSGIAVGLIGFSPSFPIVGIVVFFVTFVSMHFREQNINKECQEDKSYYKFDKNSHYGNVYEINKLVENVKWLLSR